MDNKNTALNQNVDLISTKGLDEMQREQAYKIAFRCFKAFYCNSKTFIGDTSCYSYGSLRFFCFTIRDARIATNYSRIGRL